MTKNTSQIALIQHRRGKLSELPYQLNEGEFALATDTNDIFMGNPDNPVLQDRINRAEPIFPYGNIQLLTEFTDNMKYLKYSLKMNDTTVKFPISVKANNLNPELKKGSSILINGKEIFFGKETSVINDFDYLVIRYIWTDGRDLDTDTRIINADKLPNINNIGLGYDYPQDGELGHQQQQVPINSYLENSVLFWGRDNMGTATPETPMEENILISRKTLDGDEYFELLPDILNIQLRAMWFSEVGSNPVKIEIVAYKNGVMKRDDITYSFYNEGGEKVKFLDSEGNEKESLVLDVKNMPSETRVYQLIGNLYLNKYTKESYLTLENSPETEQEKEIYYISDIVQKINSANINVKAQNDNGYLKLITTENSLTIQDGINVGGSNVEIIGFDKKSFVAIPPIKRTLQEVLDDRVSIKNFNIDNNGVDNGSKIHDSLVSMYCDIYREPKEVFFPSGIYRTSKELYLLTNMHILGEGIGRTIIKPSGDLDCLFITSDKLIRDARNIEYCDSKIGFEQSIYPTNILIENMTLDISNTRLDSIVEIGSSSNILFKNVEFIGNDISKIVNMLDNSFIHNIRFDTCVFKNNYMGLEINSNIQYLNVKNCYFENISNECIIFNGLNLIQKNNNIVDNIFTKSSLKTESVIKLNQSTSFNNIFKNIFDGEVVYRETTIPLIDYGELNTNDILNPDEDKNKYLKYNFNMPQWEYIDGFHSPNGYPTIISKYKKDKDGNVAPMYDYLLFEPATTPNKVIDITPSRVDTRIQMRCGKYADFELGTPYAQYQQWEQKSYNVGDIVEYTTDNKFFKVYQALQNTTETDKPGNSTIWKLIGSYTPEIILGKSLNLNGHVITNANTFKDIEFDLEDKKILRINDETNSIPYENRISMIDDAIPNVAYVNKISSPTKRFVIDGNSLKKCGSNRVQLLNFNSGVYGNDVYLKRISINVRRPFFSIQEDILNSVVWKSGLVYNLGDTVSYNGKYYTCVDKHLSTNWDEKLWNEVFSTTDDSVSLNDIKYISLYATNDIDSNLLLFDTRDIDVTRTEDSRINIPTLQFSTSYNKNDLVRYNNRTYICISDNTPLEDDDLHNETYWKYYPIQGNNYVFEFEKDLIRLNADGQKILEENTVVTHNLSNHRLELRLYDKNGNIIPTFKNQDNDDSIQVNPNGSIILTIELINGALDEIITPLEPEEEEQVTLTINPTPSDAQVEFEILGTEPVPVPTPTINNMPSQIDGIS